MRGLSLFGTILAAAGCASGFDPAQRAEINERAAAAMWPLADGFWWEYEDTCAPSGVVRMAPTGRREIDYCDVERDEWWRSGQRDGRPAWSLAGLWSQDTYVIVDAGRLVLAVERGLGYAYVPGIVPAYVFRWDNREWEFRTMDG